MPAITLMWVCAAANIVAIVIIFKYIYIALHSCWIAIPTLL